MRHDLTTLKIFVSVAECSNLTRAAEREHLAVSAVSKRIAELEELVRKPLLQRQARGVSLTPAGQSLLHYARQMMQVVQRMDAELAEYASGIKGHVRVHAVASALTQFLPEEIQSFLAYYPLVHISMEERTGKAVVLAVADGTADVGVITSGTPFAGLMAFPYHRDRLVIGVPKGHPLSRRKSVRFSEALKYAFVGPHAENSLSALMAGTAKACGQPLQQRVQASSFDAMCRLVETRLGITMLPEGVLAPHAAAGRIKVLRLDEQWAWRQLHLVVRDPEPLSPYRQDLARPSAEIGESRSRFGPVSVLVWRTVMWQMLNFTIRPSSLRFGRVTTRARHTSWAPADTRTDPDRPAQTDDSF